MGDLTEPRCLVSRWAFPPPVLVSVAFLLSRGRCRRSDRSFLVCSSAFFRESSANGMADDSSSVLDPVTNSAMRLNKFRINRISSQIVSVMLHVIGD